MFEKLFFSFLFNIFNRPLFTSEELNFLKVIIGEGKEKVEQNFFYFVSDALMEKFQKIKKRLNLNMEKKLKETYQLNINRQKDLKLRN